MRPFFKKIISAGEVANAYLFTGPQETCKDTPQLFAKMLLCTAGEACGQCPSCRLTSGENHPDLLIISPQKDSIRIESVRETLSRLNFRPTLGKFLVVLIPDADQMTDGAANALLKSLEEPPSHVVFLLTSSSPDLLPPTIRSRCQKILLSASGADPKQKWAELLPLWRTKIFPRLATPGNAPFATASELAETLLKETTELPAFFELMEGWWRDLAVYQSTGEECQLRVATATELAPPLTRWNREKIFRDMDLILETERAIEGNVLKQLAFERLFFELI